jgi:integrative and conjugative element protein (TIGR02256 family)
MTVLIPRHVERMIQREAERSADGKETGGILLGFEDPEGDHHWVTQAGDPGPNAVRSAVRFVRDLDHARALAAAAYEVDSSLWIGDWHTHPGGPALLSPTDLNSYRKVLASSDMTSFLAILLLPRGGWREPEFHAWKVEPADVKKIPIENLLNRRVIRTQATR